MINSGLHYYSASQSKQKLKKERISKLTKIVTDYRKCVSELKIFQKETSEKLAETLIEDILFELEKISKPIFRSLTQLDVDYLAYRMQQMAVLSEALIALKHVRDNVQSLIVSKEVTSIFDELKVANLEVGHDFGHAEVSEQLNHKIETLKQRSLKSFFNFMKDYKDKLVMKRDAIEDLSRQIRQTEIETGISLEETVDAGKASMFIADNISMPMTQVVSMMEEE